MKELDGYMKGPRLLKDAFLLGHGEKMHSFNIRQHKVCFPLYLATGQVRIYWPDRCCFCYIDFFQANLGSHVSASLHVVPRWSTNVSNPEVNISATESENLQEDAAMLLRTVHTDFSSAPVTALPAGIHFMCYVGPYSSDSTGPTASHVGKQLSFKEWPALWRDLWVDKSKYSNDEDLAWKSSCLGLLKEVAITLGVAEVASVVEGVNAWARVPCKSSSPLCLLASGGENTPGNVMWFHLETQYAEAAASVVIHRLQGLT